MALGFRPFYLVAAVFSGLGLPFWIASYMGKVPAAGYLQGLSWHAHEMIFGFAAAVMAGFLLTAVRNWTGRETPTGLRLAALVALWGLARVTAVGGPPTVAAVIDVMFLPLLGAVIAIPIWRSRNVRNYKILAVLAVLSLSNLVYHLSYLGLLPMFLTRTSLAAALDVLTILMAVVGGRVIPAFTANAVPAAKPRYSKITEIVALGSLVLILVADSLEHWYPVDGAMMTLLLALSASAHAWRLWLWQPYRTMHNMLLLMLPLAYAWIPLSLAIRSAAWPLGIPAAAATHALTIGAIGGLMLAMMTRSALGHTGRKLVAGWAESSAFVLVQTAAVVRVTASAVATPYYREAVIASGALWTLAFAVFLMRYWRILTRPRIDGLPG